MARLNPDKLTAICDTREQTPWNLAPMQMERGGLKTGDYSIKGLEDVIAIERKNWLDFLLCVGSERERFENCVLRLRGIRHAAIVIEGSWADVVRGNFGRSRVHPNAVVASVVSWQRQGIHVHFGESAEMSAYWARAYMHSIARNVFEVSTHLAKAMGVGE